MIWSQERKDAATVRDVDKYFEQVRQDRANFDRFYRGVAGYEFHCQPPSDFFSEELLQKYRRFNLDRKIQDTKNSIYDLQERVLPNLKKRLLRLENDSVELFKEDLKIQGYDIHEDFISVPEDTPDNDLIKEARKLGYIIQYKLV